MHFKIKKKYGCSLYFQHNEKVQLKYYALLLLVFMFFSIRRMALCSFRRGKYALCSIFVKGKKSLQIVLLS